MKILPCFVILCVQFVYIAGSHAAPPEPFSTVKIRGAYWGLKSVEEGAWQLAKLKEHDFNTALVKEGNYHLALDLWQGWGEIAGQLEINLFPVLNFSGPDERKHSPGRYARYVDPQGNRIENTPCPLDRQYWDHMIRKRFEQLAHLSNSTHFTGLIFDTEMYGSGVTIYRDVCVCDACWQHFVDSVSSVMPDILGVAHLSQEQRGRYLTTQNLLPMYEDVQKAQLQQILRPIEQRIHQINSQLGLGILAYADSWFYDTLIRGLGTTENPLLVFSETSYVLGYTPHVEQETARITGDTRDQAIARHIPGLWLERFYPKDIAPQCYALAAKTGGYWLYSARSLWSPVARPQPYSLYAPVDRYWEALKNANLELCRLSEQSDSYHTPLPQISRSSFYHEIEQHLETPPSLRAFIHEHFLPYILGSQIQRDPRSSHITFRGRTLSHYVPLPSSQKTAVITITHIPVGKYAEPTHYTLFDQHGWPLEQGTLDRSTPSASVTLPHDSSDHYSLLTKSGMNGVQLSFSGGAYFLEASPTFRVHTIQAASQYMFYVSPDKKKTLNVRAYTWGNDTAAMVIRSPEGQLAQETTIHGYADLEIPVVFPAIGELSFVVESGKARILESSKTASSKQRFWSLTVSPVLLKPLKDVEVYFLDEQFPYLLVPGSFP